MAHKNPLSRKNMNWHRKDSQIFPYCEIFLHCMPIFFIKKALHGETRSAESNSALMETDVVQLNHFRADYIQSAASLSLRAVVLFFLLLGVWVNKQSSHSYQWWTEGYNCQGHEITESKKNCHANHDKCHHQRHPLSPLEIVNFTLHEPSIAFSIQSLLFKSGILLLLSHSHDSLSSIFYYTVIFLKDFRWRKRTMGNLRCSLENHNIGYSWGIGCFGIYHVPPVGCRIPGVGLLQWFRGFGFHMRVECMILPFSNHSPDSQYRIPVGFQ